MSEVKPTWRTRVFGICAYVAFCITFIPDGFFSFDAPLFLKVVALLYLSISAFVLTPRTWDPNRRQKVFGWDVSEGQGLKITGLFFALVFIALYVMDPEPFRQNAFPFASFSCIFASGVSGYQYHSWRSKKHSESQCE